MTLGDHETTLKWLSIPSVNIEVRQNTVFDQQLRAHILRSGRTLPPLVKVSSSLLSTNSIH